MRHQSLCVVLAPKTSTRADIDSAQHDTAALSMALKLAEESGAPLMALNVVGPLQGCDISEEALRLGCSTSVCVRSPVPLDFFGAARLMAAVLRESLPQLIVCGDQYVDNGAATIAGALAHELGWPLVTGVLEARLNSPGIWLQARTEASLEEQQRSVPLLLAALQTHSEPLAPQPGPAPTRQVREIAADSLLESLEELRERASHRDYIDFSARPAGPELMTEPAELLARLLQEGFWKP